jgi:hypothetical protein
MKKLLWGVCLAAGLSQGQIRDDGGRYIVQPEARAAVRGGASADKNLKDAPVTVQRGKTADECSAILIRYDVSQVPLETPLNSVIWYKGKASGPGSNPCFAICGVQNDWDEKTVSMNTLPAKLERIEEVTVKPDVSGPVPFPVSRYVQQHLKDGKVSFLIEMRSAPGFSQQVEFSEVPSLSVVKAQTPDYELPELLRPVWKGSRMVNETAVPTSYDGKPAEANLAFIPSKIISVKNYALDKTYEEGKDYVIDGRTIRLISGSAIPFFKYEELYHNNPEAKPGVMKTVDGGYMTFSESAFFNDKQLAVTYEHADLWDGPVPQPAKNLLPKTFQALENKKPLKLVVFGDSISVGASASGKSNRAPFMPRWGDLVADELNRVYGSAIDYLNPSLGGMRADWGKNVIDGLVAFEKPDLVILGFGMNDGASFPVEQFASNTRAMMESVRKQNPDAEFILLMSFQPNSRWRSLETMSGYLAALKGMEGPGVAVADLWSMHGYLLKNKTYWDMTGNHVNHPNDFMVRVYAQTLLAGLGVD